MRTFLLVAAVLAMASTAAAQSTKWSAPRNADGHPDLDGVWTNASMTKLTRPRSAKGLILTEAQATALANGEAHRMAASSAPTDPQARALKATDPGGYNTFWLDSGKTMGRVKGEFRSSWIVDPIDGQLPLSDTGRKLAAEAEAFSRRADTPADPEALEPWDRCLISSRGSGGPGMLNNIYNSNYQIVQTPSSVAIVVEMVHDVRNIPLFPNKAAAQAGHGPTMIHPWLGDSVGWWEGETLVVETTSVNAEQGRAGPLFLTPEGRVTERFTRVSKDQLLYEFIVEDSTYYSQPWRAEMTLSARQDQLYEYACHEGNYAMSNILRGARIQESGKTASTAEQSSPTIKKGSAQR